MRIPFRTSQLRHGTDHFKRLHAASPGISYTVETSVDVQTWTTEGVVLSELDGHDRRSARMILGAPSRFLRLVVSEDPQ